MDTPIGPRKLNLSDIQGFLYLWMVGCLTSILSFSIEFFCVWFNKQLKKRELITAQEMQNDKDLYDFTF